MKPLALIALALLASGNADATDLSGLTRNTFAMRVPALARAEGKVVMYNFAGGFGDVWRRGLIAAFEAKYGIKVDYHDVRGGEADQQLIALRKSGRPPPVDVYFAGGADFARLHEAGIIARIDLADLLPELATVPSSDARAALGIPTGGTYPIVHRNQSAIGYDLAHVAAPPRDFDALLAWSEQHPGRFAMTLPVRGGSGGAFLYSAALHYGDPACRARLVAPVMDQTAAEDFALTAPCLAPVWTYFRRLLHSAQLTNGNADTMNLINNGAAWMGTVWEDAAVSNVLEQQLPDTFRLTLLSDGEAGSGDAIFLVAGAAHPAAALLLINAAFGRDFQIYKLRHKASRSPRPDVDVALAPIAVRDHMVPAPLFARFSIQANWPMISALALALDENVLSRL
jgi:multiple sugar transport system substrate-binding protein/putative spermidine/putrescine transport system substrate-binding protein